MNTELQKLGRLPETIFAVSENPEWCFIIGVQHGLNRDDEYPNGRRCEEAEEQLRLYAAERNTRRTDDVVVIRPAKTLDRLKTASGHYVDVFAFGSPKAKEIWDQLDTAKYFPLRLITLGKRKIWTLDPS